jgi:hypothetical protein
MFVFSVCRLVSKRYQKNQIGSDSWLTLLSWLLNQLDFSDFAWHTKNSLFDVKFTKKGVECQKRALMITDSNQALHVKMSGCGVQEEVTMTLDNVCIVKS